MGPSREVACSAVPLRLGPRHHLHRLATVAAGLLLASVLVACTTDDASSPAPMELETIPYGDAAMQEGDLYLPAPTGRDHPIVTLVHGGYWSVGLDRAAMAGLAEDLVSLGYAVWNIDYRRVGDDGGGWPGTLEDVAAAVDLLDDLAADHGLDLDRHVALGHSAGSQLAFWSAGRSQLDAGQPGADPVVVPTALVSLSGVLDLGAAAELPDLGRAANLRVAVRRLLGGGPDEVDERYEAASPVALAPLEVPQLLVHGVVDEIVPLSQSERYALAAGQAGDDVELVRVRGADHFDVAASTTGWWSIVLEWLPGALER